VSRHAVGAKAAVRDLDIGHEETTTGILGDGGRRPDARHVADGLAPLAYKVVVALGDVGVITLRAFSDLDEAELAHRHELVQRVVDGRPTDLGQSHLRTVVNLLRREMDVVTDEHLGHGAPLRAQAPITVAQSRQQIFHVYQISS
jgi:hypothetical protein